MPWAHTLDKERSAILVKVSGRLNDKELILGLDRVGLDPDYRKDFRFFLDYTEVTELQLSAATMMAVARYPIFSSESRRSFLVSHGFFASALQFVRAHAVGKFQVFENRQDALAWLNEDFPPEKAIL